MNSEGRRVLEDVMGYKEWSGNAIDGGAHMGVWSKAISEFFDKVYAYEPNGGMMSALRHNLSGVPGVKIRQKALGWVEYNKVRMMRRHVGKDDTTRISPDGEEAEAATIDTEDIHNLSFIKLDLEGFEYFALRGAERTILRDRPVILMEEKDHLPQFYGIPMRAARDYLISLGMTVVKEYRIDILLDWPNREAA